MMRQQQKKKKKREQVKMPLYAVKSFHPIALETQKRPSK